MSNHQKGYSRDSSIISDIEECGILDTEQIRLLRFKGLKYGRRIAQKRLLSLHKRGRISRTRLSIGHPYYYYIGKQGRQVEHRLGVNWIYCWFVANLKTWQRLKWEYEVDIGGVRPDALATIYNTIERTQRTVCVEFDRDTESSSDIREKYIDEDVLVVTVGDVEKFAGFQVMALDDIKRGLGSA